MGLESPYTPEMVRNRKIGTCAYCGAVDVELSHDHVINKGFWVKGKRPKRPIMVWTCDKCHTRFDKQFDYFRANILMTSEPTDAVWELFNAKVKRSVRRPEAPKVLLETIRSGREHWAQNEYGLMVPAIKLTLYEDAHYLSALKMIMGLHFHHYKEIADNQRAGVADPKISQPEVSEAIDIALEALPFKSIKHLGDGHDVFCYRYCDLRHYEPLPFDSMWVLCFFGGRFIYGFVKTKEEVTSGAKKGRKRG